MILLGVQRQKFMKQCLPLLCTKQSDIFYSLLCCYSVLFFLIEKMLFMTVYINFKTHSLENTG